MKEILKKHANKKAIFMAVAYVFGMALSGIAAHYATGLLVISTALIMLGAIAIDRKL